MKIKIKTNQNGKLKAKNFQRKKGKFWKISREKKEIRGKLRKIKSLKNNDNKSNMLKKYALKIKHKLPLPRSIQTEPQPTLIRPDT